MGSDRAVGVVLALRVPGVLADDPRGASVPVSGWFVGLLALVVLGVYSGLAVREELSGYRAIRE
jgi:hypothetical protein